MFLSIEKNYINDDEFYYEEINFFSERGLLIRCILKGETFVYDTHYYVDEKKNRVLGATVFDGNFNILGYYVDNYNENDLLISSSIFLSNNAEILRENFLYKDDLCRKIEYYICSQYIGFSNVDTIYKGDISPKDFYNKENKISSFPILPKIIDYENFRKIK